MTPEQLKASIISFALQGKLLEQTADGTVKEFVTKYKIKEKNYSEEVGFDIPENWAWVSFDDVCDILGGFAFKSTDYQFDGIRVIRISDFNENGLIDKDIKYYKEDSALEKYLIKKNDILMCMTGGTVGKTCFLQNNEEPLYLNQRVADIRSKYPSYIDTKYLYLVVCSFYIKNIVNASKTSTNDNISMGTIQNFPLPLPPLEEQHRIVAKIEELLPYVDRYAEAYDKIEQFNAKFPEDMEKSILQYAIQGKLVEQRPEEGTAEELYQQIQKERKRYKIKELSVDAIDDVPFDIPDTWKWIHLQDIVKKTIKRGKSPKYTEKSNVQVFAQKCNVKSGGINMGLALFLDEDTVEKYPVEEYMCNGDIVINSTGGGTMGRVGIFHNTDRIDNMSIVPDGHVTIIRACDTVDYKYLYYIIKHNQRYLETQGEGSTNQTELKPLTIASLVLPLPPLAEQHRIVAKIEELLPYCDKLANRK